MVLPKSYGPDDVQLRRPPADADRAEHGLRDRAHQARGARSSRAEACLKAYEIADGDAAHGRAHLRHRRLRRRHRRQGADQRAVPGLPLPEDADDRRRRAPPASTASTT